MNTTNKHIGSLIFMTFVIMHSCTSDPNYLFETLPSSHTNIDFINEIVETQDLNILNFHYIYNGGGVGVGDFNNDGLQDLVFTGNQVASKIYLNKGNLEFEDITLESGFETKGWSTGVAIVDINGDGWQDIYISTGGYECDGSCANQLFVNRGKEDVSFEESASKYGLQDGDYTQQAAFFDYDDDGDLDVYLLHNVIDNRDKNAPVEKKSLSEKSKDKLLENRDGNYVDVSEAMGIVERGYGLGIAISDFNKDGLPDIYIANDFLSDDNMYINQGGSLGSHNGFLNQGHKLLKHTSYNSMGVDIADVNNDNEQDILVLDMLPEYNERQKTMLGFMNYNKFQRSLKKGYNAQFVRNTMQLGNGKLDGEMIPYSEVGHLTGVYDTDWSWCPLIADFDNDGDKDIFISNGYGRDITDLDFINYSNQNTSAFGTPKSRQDQLYKVVEKMDEAKMPNYIFENVGNLGFTRRNDQWMKSTESISNGAVYSDLDNDGDLDLVVNNIDQPAFVLKNTTITTNNQSTEHDWIIIDGLENGAIVKLISSKKGRSTYYQSSVRGYLSSVDNRIHIGLGKDYGSTVIRVTNNDSMSIKFDVKRHVNKIVDINEIRTIKSQNRPTKSKTASLRLRIDKQEDQKESVYQDFNMQPLLLSQHSRQGPCLAVANLDGLPGDEYFVGGSKGNSGKIIFPNGSKVKEIELDHKNQEDIDAHFFDIDSDGDLDLYVVEGGVEGFGKGDPYQDRIYLNDGNGNFEESKKKSPAKMSGGCIASADFDKDGDIDLFVGGRVVPGAYPDVPKSMLLRNDNGLLVECTDQVIKGLDSIGMLTDALWTDIDNDEDMDLIVVGKWMPITVFVNHHGFYTEKREIPNSKGLWNTIAAIDLDKNGYQDYIFGNHGLNSRLSASKENPLVLFRGDIDENNSNDPIIGVYTEDENGEKKLFPLQSRDDIIGQVPKIKNKFKSYENFGKATLSEIIEIKDFETDFFTVENLSSSYIKVDAYGFGALNPLPIEAQISPVNDILVTSTNNNRLGEIFMVGNDYTREKTNGWQDASNGLILKYNWKNEFESLITNDTGFLVGGDARRLVSIKDKEGDQMIMVTQNSGPILKFEESKLLPNRNF